MDATGTIEYNLEQLIYAKRIRKYLLKSNKMQQK